MKKITRVHFFLLLSALWTIKANQFILITSLYNETNPERISEYITCIEKNMSHNLIKKVHVIYDTSKDADKNIVLEYLKKNTIATTMVKHRPSFAFCFDLANRHYPDEHIILANADIYFNQTLYSLYKYDLTNNFLALTRWNVKQSGELEIFKQFKSDGSFWPEISYYSQDAWMFKTPLTTIDCHDICMGGWNSDSILAYRAHEAGLNIFNPCLTIQCCHYHLSNIRNYEFQGNTLLPVKPLPWTTLYPTN